jgi:amino acid transporter
MSGLKRDIGLAGAAFIALNGVVGAGIFAMPQALVDGVGMASPYMIIGFGVAMVFVAMVFGDLASRFDQAGGMVVYADAAFGRFAGFQVGWLYYIARLAAIAANTNALLTYVAVFMPGADSGMLRIAFIAVFWITLSAINVAGVKGAVRTLTIVTLAKLTPLAALVIWGLYEFSHAMPAPQAPHDAGAVGEIGLLMLYAFVGFEMATLTAGETRNSKSALPRALIGTVAATGALYFLVQLAYVSIMQGATPEGAPLAAAAEVLAGPWGATAIAAAAILSIGGNLFAASIATPRLTFAMAEEKSLPTWFGAVHSRFATPVNSIVVLGLIVGTLAMSSAFVWLAVVSALARMIVYLVCTGALVRLRLQARERHSAPRRIVRQIAPVLAAVLCVWAMAQAKLDAWTFLAAFVAAGTAIYLVSRWTYAARARAAAPPVKS